MTAELNLWEAAYAHKRRGSVEDILRRIAADFSREYNAVRAGGYRFLNGETFSYGA